MLGFFFDLNLIMGIKYAESYPFLGVEIMLEAR